MLMQSGSLGLQNLISDSYRFAHRPPRRAATALQTQRRGRVGAGGAPIGARDPPEASGPAPARAGGIRTPQGPHDGRLLDPLWALRWIFLPGPIWDHSRSPLWGLLRALPWNPFRCPLPFAVPSGLSLPRSVPSPLQAQRTTAFIPTIWGFLGTGAAGRGSRHPLRLRGVGSRARPDPPGQGEERGLRHSALIAA